MTSFSNPTRRLIPADTAPDQFPSANINHLLTESQTLYNNQISERDFIKRATHPKARLDQAEYRKERKCERKDLSSGLIREGRGNKEIKIRQQSEVFDKSEYNDGVFMYGKLSTSQSISVLVHPSINNIIFQSTNHQEILKLPSISLACSAFCKPSHLRKQKLPDKSS